MSYYTGKVVKLTKQGNLGHNIDLSTWKIRQIFDFDSEVDENMHIDMSDSEKISRAVFLPIGNIQGLDADVLDWPAVQRRFDLVTSTETWTVV
jgi:hypothetical protein